MIVLHHPVRRVQCKICSIPTEAKWITFDPETAVNFAKYLKIPKSSVVENIKNNPSLVHQ